MSQNRAITDKYKIKLKIIKRFGDEDDGDDDGDDHDDDGDDDGDDDDGDDGDDDDDDDDDDNYNNNNNKTLLIPPGEIKMTCSLHIDIRKS